MQTIPLTQGKVALVDDDVYDRIGHFKWLTQASSKTCWYAKRMISVPNGQPGKSPRRFEWMHRLITDCPDGMFVDHINGNGLDNRRENLRICTPKQNQANRRKPKLWMGKPPSSKYKGVKLTKDKRPWKATIRHECKQMHLGCFDTEIEAAIAYDVAATKFRGEFARLNFPRKVKA